MREEDSTRQEIREFSCGDDPWHEEINRFVRGGQAWKEQRSGKSQTLLLTTAEDDRIIGFASVVRKSVGFPAFSSEPKIPAYLITYLAIDAKHQGIGYGAFLMRSIVATAKAAGRPAVFLYVDSRNEPAKNLYAKAGFVPFSDKRVVEEDDATFVGMVLVVA
jgi:ribosomal protein S18 acetylase RimI-like enzyme